MFEYEILVYHINIRAIVQIEFGGNRISVVTVFRLTYGGINRPMLVKNLK